MAGAAGYQKAIDGIRAIAIVLVLLFHFNLGGASRGFLGVDIFFVISGYLVGGHILRQTAAGQFDLLDFYCKRIARIVPALVAVVAITLLAGYLILLPDDYVRLAASIRAAILITANQHFYDSLDYFGPTKLDQYFLHSWSLSIEEQFYLFFPIVGFIIARLGARPVFIVTCLAVASWAWQMWLSSTGHNGAFYFLFARSWELLVGVLIAIIPPPQKLPEKFGSHIPALGLAMAVAPAFVPVGSSYLLSTFLQLICVAGTALLIGYNALNKTNVVAHFLSTRVFVFIGLISYSLYLIHWPLMTLSYYWLIEPPSAFVRFGLLMISIMLAWLSLRCVEMPIRNWVRNHHESRGKVVLAGLAVMSATVLTAFAVVSASGFPNRVSERALAKLEQEKRASPLRKKCHSDESEAPIDPEDACKLGDASVPPTSALWSDSHGVEVAYAMAPLLQQRRDAMLQISSSSCVPLLDVFLEVKPGCLAHNDATLAMLRRTPSIQTVIIMWQQNGYHEVNFNMRMAAFQRTVQALKKIGKTVIVVGPIPMPPYHVPSAMARVENYGRSDFGFSFSRQQLDFQSGGTAKRLQAIASTERITYVDPTPLYCDTNKCNFVEGETAVYYDNHHLSLFGAQKLANRLSQLTGDLGPTGSVAGN